MINKFTTEVYCIKDYTVFYEKFIFKKNNIYNVKYFHNGTIRIYDSDNNVLDFLKDSIFFLYEFNNYFITIKEYRKLKLQKINESR